MREKNTRSIIGLNRDLPVFVHRKYASLLQRNKEHDRQQSELHK
jgi:hypothetical protein